MEKQDMINELNVVQNTLYNAKNIIKGIKREIEKGVKENQDAFNREWSDVLDLLDKYRKPPESSYECLERITKGIEEK